MEQTYIAKIHLSRHEMIEKSGEDIDELYAWMLVQAEGRFGDVKGEIREVNTDKIVRKFCKCPPD